MENPESALLAPPLECDVLLYLNDFKHYLLDHDLLLAMFNHSVLTLLLFLGPPRSSLLLLGLIHFAVLLRLRVR